MLPTRKKEKQLEHSIISFTIGNLEKGQKTKKIHFHLWNMTKNSGHKFWFC